MTIKSSPRQRSWAYLGTVQSNTTSGWEYEIRRNPTTGKPGCACVGYAIRSHCSHLKVWAMSQAVAATTTAPLKTTPAPAFNESTVRLGAETFTVRRAISFGTINPAEFG